MTRRIVLALLAAASAACAVGPEYRRPSAPAPASYKETGTAQTGEWKPAHPSDEAARGKWWEVFGDPELNALEEQVVISNQNVAQAEAAFRGASALARAARAAMLPTVGASASAARSSGLTTHPSGATGAPAPTVTVYSVPVDLAWELDVFGRIRRTAEAGRAGAQASAADLASVTLAMQAELAADFFTLHGLDTEKELLDSTVAAYRTALELTTNRYKQGVVSGVDVAQAQTQLDTTRAQATDLTIARAQAEHAIAVLVGKAPSEFAIEPRPIRAGPPEIPPGIPSEMLERRPDVAAAERLAAAANAQIGVARAAWFPTLTLGGTFGYQASTLANFFSLPNRFWSLGPALAETLFTGGRRRAASDQAIAAYDASVAAYRESVLTALQEVEDNLAALRILSEEAGQQADAVAAAERALAMAKNRYQAGVTTYLEVVTAQSTALTNQRAAVDLLTRRMAASVNLVKALGGGWGAPAPTPAGPGPTTPAPAPPAAAAVD